jgi:hypothetical protein
VEQGHSSLAAVVLQEAALQAEAEAAVVVAGAGAVASDVDPAGAASARLQPTGVIT